MESAKTLVDEVEPADDEEMDTLTIGRRIRQLRTAQGMTLDALASAVDRAPSQLSMIENGRREPKLTLLRAIARALGTSLDALLQTEPLDERASMEIALERAMRGQTFQALGIAPFRIAKTMPDDALRTMLALQGAVLMTVYLVSPYPLPMIAALTAWGALNFAIGTPIQTRILSWTADAPNLASSLIPSGFNIGIAVAASFGSMLLASGYSYRALPLVGVAAMTVATAVALGSYLRELRSGAAMPLAASAQAPQ